MERLVIVDQNVQVKPARRVICPFLEVGRFFGSSQQLLVLELALSEYFGFLWQVLLGIRRLENRFELPVEPLAQGPFVDELLKMSLIKHQIRSISAAPQFFP